MEGSQYITRRVGGYDLVEPPLGRGQFGEVFKGIQFETGEFAAVKKIPKNKVRGTEHFLLQEINNMLNIRSEHVATFVRTPTQSESNIYIYAQLCEGGDLKDALQKYQSFDEQLVIKFGIQIALGLQDMKSANIIHRDLKPANIILTNKDISTSDVKIADLGLSKIICPEMDMMAQTICGSPYYMAPEVFKPGISYDFKADVWSLGVLIYELITGQVAFYARSLTELHQLHSQGPTLSGNISQPMKELLESMLSYNSEERLSIEEVIASLQSMLSN